MLFYDEARSLYTILYFASFHIWLHPFTPVYIRWHSFASVYILCWSFFESFDMTSAIFSRFWAEGGEGLEFGRESHWTQIWWLRQSTSGVGAFWSTRIHARRVRGEKGWTRNKTDKRREGSKVLESKKPVWLAISTTGSRLENHTLSAFSGMLFALSKEWWTQFWTWDWTMSRWRLWQRSQATVALPLTATDALSRCILTLSSALRSTTLRSIWSERKRSVVSSRRI